jgi:bacterioferritin
MGKMTETPENRLELLTLLNKALARELQVSIQYMLQHTLLTGGKEHKTGAETSQSKQGKFIGSHSPLWLPGTSLKKIAVTEMRHAEAVAERIVSLEERPTTQPDTVVIGDSPTEMIGINRDAEEEAIRLYNQIIDLAKKQGDEVTTKLFQQILSDEENHLKIFKDIL